MGGIGRGMTRPAEPLRLRGQGRFAAAPEDALRGRVRITRPPVRPARLKMPPLK